MEDHNHQLENAQLRLFTLVAKLDGLDVDASIETKNYVQRKVYVQKEVVDAFETFAQEGKINFEWVSKEIDGEVNQILRVKEKVKMPKRLIIVAFKCL
jgi:hypothetical protein